MYPYYFMSEILEHCMWGHDKFGPLYSQLWRRVVLDWKAKALLCEMKYSGEEYENKIMWILLNRENTKYKCNNPIYKERGLC